MEKRVLTPEEKIRLLTGKDFWHTDDLDGKLDHITMSDGPVGLRTERVGEDGKPYTLPAVAYPAIQVLANSWDRQLAHEVGSCLADDCRERDVQLLLAPGVNIKRVPVNGRNFEYFSEDPVLAGTMAKAYVEGVQEKGIGVCVKHFCCNNLEYDRLHQSSDVDERTLREIYYRPFEIVCEAKPVAVMCSYNRVNGVYAAEYRRGFALLREQFGFDGAVISDWGAVRDRTASCKAGLDLEMPYSEGSRKKLAADLAAGTLTEGEIDACADRVLHLVHRLKEMGKGSFPSHTEAERIAVARRVVEEGAVLLKNEGVLPLGKGESVSVCGGYARPENTMYLAGGGSAKVEWGNAVFDLPAALEREGLAVKFEPAFDMTTVHSFVQNARTAVENAARSAVNLVCVGTGAYQEFEEGDRASCRLSPVQERTILDTARVNGNTVVVIFAGSAVDMRPWIDKVAAVLFVGFPGMGGDEAVARLLTGKVNPSGKLSETFAPDPTDVPAMHAPVAHGVTRYAEGLDVGYRHFAVWEDLSRPGRVGAFGYGLSYATFSYHDLTVEVKGDRLELSYVVANPSDVDGREISQVYLSPCAPLVYRPVRELKAYSKDFVPAGGRVKVKCELCLRDFAYWSTAEEDWKAEDGVYQIQVGRSSADIVLCATVVLRDGKFER